MTHFMSYVVLLAAAIGACGAVLEATLERNVPRRWIWLSCLAATLVATGLAMVWPASASESVVTRSLGSSTLVPSEPTTSWLPATPAEASFDVLAAVDAILPLAWLLSSAGLLLMIGFGQWRLRRERSRARPSALAGHPVLVSESIGPAVAGLRSPVVFIPNWVVALDEPSQRLLMAHEIEHIRERDTAVLFAGALAAALVPWNPVVWWMVRRLRLAVEQDCDARVLAANPGVRRYADLLLLAASRHGLTTRLLAAHFGEHSSDLVRRIDSMTRRGTISWRHVIPATAIAALLVVAACEAPRPAPVAPIATRNEIAKEEAPTYAEIEKNTVRNDKFSVLVFSSDGKQLARYAGEIPVAHLPADGVQNVKADEFECGASRCYAVRITLKPGYELNLQEIELDKPPLTRGEHVQEFRIPAIEIDRSDSGRVAGKNARRNGKRDSLVGPFEPEVAVDTVRNGSASLMVNASSLPQDASTTQDDVDKLVLYHPHDPKSVGPVPSNVIVYNSNGSEIARFPNSGNALGSISLFGVESIKEQKTGDCSPMACPLARITLKPGYRLISYQQWKERRK